MIARIWRGIVRLEDADEYAAYIRDTGFTEYAGTAHQLQWLTTVDRCPRCEPLCRAR